MILAESGRSRAGGASLGAYAQDDCVLPTTRFPNLTDLREALVTETAQAGASVEGAPRGRRGLRGPTHRDAQRNVAARRRSNHDQARALASSRIWGDRPSPINPVANSNWSVGHTNWRHLTSSALRNRAECLMKDASAEDADAPNVRDRVTRGASPRASLAVVLTSPDER